MKRGNSDISFKKDKGQSCINLRNKFIAKGRYILMFTTRNVNGHFPRFGALEIIKYIGPGFLVTVGFIDPGNWAANIAAGSIYGYHLLWMISLSTFMLIILQHNAAHLGIVTGLCLSEASTKFLGKWTATILLASAMGAAIATALAEILGAAIGLQMLFRIPLTIGATLTAILVIWMLISNTYRKLEKWIIGFVSLIGLSFIFELILVKLQWSEALLNWFVPSVPIGSLPIVMSVLGAVVMPHNIFLHSEIIQSRQWNVRGEEQMKKQLKYEFTDTLAAMMAGWAINSAIILVAASVFYSRGIVVFGIALIFAGFSSSITAAMSGGSIFAGIFREPFDISDSHSRTGVIITIGGGLLLVFFIKDPFRGLIWSQIALSIQLPWTIFSLIFLTSSQRVMGKFANTTNSKVLLWFIFAVVFLLNILLVLQIIHSR
jgi:manganese transport protein